MEITLIIQVGNHHRDGCCIPAFFIPSGDANISVEIDIHQIIEINQRRAIHKLEFIVICAKAKVNFVNENMNLNHLLNHKTSRASKSSK